jgi:hypothetical protein
VKHVNYLRLSLACKRHSTFSHECIGIDSLDNFNCAHIAAALQLAENLLYEIGLLAVVIQACVAPHGRLVQHLWAMNCLLADSRRELCPPMCTFCFIHLIMPSRRLLFYYTVNYVKYKQIRSSPTISNIKSIAYRPTDLQFQTKQSLCCVLCSCTPVRLLLRSCSLGSACVSGRFTEVAIATIIFVNIMLCI